MIKAIIIDFYGVIWSDPYTSWIRNHQGFDRNTEFIDASAKFDKGQISVAQFHELLSKISGRDIGSITEDYSSGSTIDRGVIELIAKLHTSYRVALLSNAPSDVIRGILKGNDLEKYFDQLIISSEVGLAKPAKAIFELTLEKLNIEASQALFIDDSQYYIEGAEKVGIKCIQFISTTQLTNDLKDLNIIQN